MDGAPRATAWKQARPLPPMGRAQSCPPGDLSSNPFTRQLQTLDGSLSLAKPQCPHLYNGVATWALSSSRKQSCVNHWCCSSAYKSLSLLGDSCKLTLWSPAAFRHLQMHYLNQLPHLGERAFLSVAHMHREAGLGHAELGWRPQSRPDSRGFHLVPTLGLVSSRSAPHHESLEGHTGLGTLGWPLVFGSLIFAARKPGPQKRRSLSNSTQQTRARARSKVPFPTSPLLGTPPPL